MGGCCVKCKGKESWSFMSKLFRAKPKAAPNSTADQLPAEKRTSTLADQVADGETEAPGLANDDLTVDASPESATDSPQGSRQDTNYNIEHVDQVYAAESIHITQHSIDQDAIIARLEDHDRKLGRVLSNVKHIKANTTSMDNKMKDQEKVSRFLKMCFAAQDTTDQNETVRKEVISISEETNPKELR